MEKFIIEGGNRLSGRVKISGAKNAALPIMAATLLGAGTSRLENMPDLRDITTMANILRIIGAKVYRQQHTLTIDTDSCDHPVAPYELVSTMRASFCVLGPLLGRFGRARVSLPGGCVIGLRPVDRHIKGIKALGAQIDMDQGYVVATASRLRGAKINFDIKTVTGTENVMMAATTAQGTTVIENAAKEPEVVALAHFLRKMGAHIEGAGTDKIEIEGIDVLCPADATIIPDRIETATFLIAGMITRGKVTTEGCSPSHLSAVLEKLQECGAKIHLTDQTIELDAPERIEAADLVAAPYPGYPTDLQPLHTALVSLASGSSVITDTVHPDRFTHVPELRRLGAEIALEDRVAVVKGVKSLKGAPVMASDIRAGAALVAAALAAQGETSVSRIYHIDRGYEKLEEKLSALGAQIRRAKTDNQ
ncbi:MAG: UDP-N-acetylglucosamine 1-carboxyvinyltransferase [Candidatus Latescibacteria bacterium 4484_181]|nr:MAG: UDP-N-acetylglucosamine 1-carboxyvinyltransferase [Candidatus Latescibacteria bacterium 4484_181]RKY68064.1 MAG: UDP-N-acetylglucosamine 1-carboxyvinyltransferase [Candidatus Latescibacterota bacterium]RKY71568.1 MAG: UDP-N-acetylglucosamine 1-carboxyvinyltransferase [Candidatus Latescibacterota bacterium]